MTDGEVVRITRRMDRLNRQLFKLADRIRESDHPNAEELYQVLWDEFLNPTCATDVVHHGLTDPSRWESDGGGEMRHVGASRAVQSRKGKP
jgi:hypothetical protein